MGGVEGVQGEGEGGGGTQPYLYVSKYISIYLSLSPYLSICISTYVCM